MAKCCVCDYENDADGSANCLRCGSNLKNPREEAVQKKSGRCKFKNEGAFAFWYGTAILTDKRFICLDDSSMSSLGLAGMGAANALAGSFFKVGEHGFSFATDDLASVGYGRQGFRKTLAIRTKSGKAYHFLIPEREEWKALLEKCVK